MFIAKKVLTRTYAISFLSILLIGILVFSLTNLKFLVPGKDDYCIAADVSKGVLWATINTFQSWGGSLTTVFIDNFLVGLPLTFLNYNWASLGPFIITFISLAWFIYAEFSSLILRISRLERIFLLTFLMNGLLAYFWFTYNTYEISVNRVNLLDDLTDSIFMWQTVTVTYILIPILILAAVKQISKNELNKYKITGFILGVFIGMCDYVSVFVCLLFLLIQLFRNFKIFQTSNVSRDFMAYLRMILGILLGLIVAMSSPGSRYRSKLLNTNIDLESLRRVPIAILRGFRDYSLMVFNPKSILVLILGISIAFLIDRFDIRGMKVILLNVTLLLILEILVNSCLEILAYTANWHRLPQYLLHFYLFLLIGILFGDFLRNLVSTKFTRFAIRIQNLLKIVSVVTLLVIFVSSCITMAHVLETRNSSWKISENYHLIDDIKTKWINDCWVDLGKYRKLNEYSVDKI